MAECATCTTVGTLAARVARLLNDLSDDGSSDYVRWSKATLIDYMNEGLAQVAAHRPEAFSSQVPITLKPGSVQSVPGMDIVSIDNNVKTAADGSVVHGEAIITTDQKFASALSGKPTCVASPTMCGANGVAGAYTATTVSLHPSVPGSFEVYPAVPPGQSPVVLATVAGMPCLFCPEQWKECVGIQTKYDAAVVEWMLYRALSTDSESATAGPASQRAFTNFYQILGVQLTRRAQYNTDVANGVQSPRAPATTYGSLENRR